MRNAPISMQQAPPPIEPPNAVIAPMPQEAEPPSPSKLGAGEGEARQDDAASDSSDDPMDCDLDGGSELDEPATQQREHGRPDFLEEAPDYRIARAAACS